MHRSGSSILAAVPIWHNFMAEALPLYAPETFPKPEPIASSKPILRGEYLLGGQPHSILYYIDRRDPTGSAPLDPYADPQFANWETAVQEWAKKNFTPPAAPLAGTTGLFGAPPQVTISEPRPGVFAGSQVAVSALVQPSIPVMKIRLLFNGALVQEFPGPFITAYQLHWSFVPPSFQLQNVVRVEAIDLGGKMGSAEVVVYK